MRETYQPPTTSPAGPPHDHTYPRHSREGGNPSSRDHPPGATALLPPATEFDKIRQNATKCNETSCAHARARQRSSVSFPSAWTGFDVSLGVAVPYPSCQYMKPNRRQRGALFCTINVI